MAFSLKLEKIIVKVARNKETCKTRTYFEQKKAIQYEKEVIDWDTTDLLSKMILSLASIQFVTYPLKV